MTKLTKTQQDLIERARRNPHGQVIVVTGLRTGKGRPRSYGHRERDAICKLREMGLLVYVDGRKYIDCRNSYSDHSFEATYRLV